MKIIDAYIIVKETNSRNLPTQHKESIAGKPILHYVIENLKKIKSIRDIAILCESIDPFLEEVKNKYQVRLHDSTLPDIPRRKKFRKARLWSTWSWRGGLDYTSVFDEEGWPHAFLGVMQAHPCDFVYQVGMEWLCLDPQLSEDLIQYGSQLNQRGLAVFHRSAPGFIGYLLSQSVIVQMAGQNLSLRDALAVTNRGKDNIDEAKGISNFEVDSEICEIQNRFIADTPRALRWLEKLIRQEPKLLASKKAMNWAQIAQKCPFTDGSPEEIEWEWQGLKLEHQLTRELFEKICEELFEEPDILITLDGRGNLLNHPQWFDWSQELKEKGCHGLHLRLHTKNLKPNHFEDLNDSQADIISFVIDDFFNDESKIKEIEKFCQSRNQLEGPLIVVEMARTKELLAHWEGFWDRWFPLVDRILWRAPSNHLNQFPNLSLLDINRRIRKPCRKLEKELLIRWNGAIPLCREDWNDQHLLGQFPKIKLKDGKKSIATKWLEHQKRQWKEPCEDCKAWDRLTP